MTIRQALNVQERTVSYRDAEVLLAAVLQTDRSFLYAHPEQPLTAAQQRRYEEYLAAREGNNPVAYIIGHKEFYGRPFTTDARALIPRPETEALIEHALAFLRDRPSRKVLELGTGAGNIAVTLALELPEAEILATDVSADALALAKENWQKLGESARGSRPDFMQAALFDHQKIRGSRPFDLIIANLPYVPTTWKMDPAAQPEVVFREPDVALFGGQDGLDIYRQFFQEAPAYLKEDGQIIIEYGEDQTAALLPLARRAFPHRKASVYKDYAGLDRVLVIG